MRLIRLALSESCRTGQFHGGYEDQANSLHLINISSLSGYNGKSENVV
jgi:hypothetical protein